MDVWDLYEERLNLQNGQTDNPRRTSSLNHTQSYISRKLPRSLSYKEVVIDDCTQQVAIMDTTDFDIKKIFSLPGESLPHGSIVEWSDAYWIITEIDAHKEVYTEGRMRQCNYLLKWINDDGIVISKWSIVEDGTKYLIGERSEAMMSIGDARIAITVGKDKDTNKLSRGRRFLIDDLDSDDVLAYQITKPNKLFNVYNGKGVFRFILNEVNLTDDDNVELRIADYYNWKPKTTPTVSDVKTDETIEEIVKNAIEEKANEAIDIENRKVWL